MAREYIDDPYLVAKFFKGQVMVFCPSHLRGSKYATGNLLSTFKIEGINDNVCRCSIGGKQADYMPYTNEKWISPRWHGKKNPNESWWDLCVSNTLRILGVDTVADFNKFNEMGARDRNARNRNKRNY